MIPVIPKWDISAVPAWQELWVDNAAGESELCTATATLLNLMWDVGVVKLTEENVEEAWRRIAIHQALIGSFVTNNETGTHVFLTRSDVIRHIGAEAETESLSRDEFCSRMFTYAVCHDDSKLPFHIANGNASLLDLSL